MILCIVTHALEESFGIRIEDNEKRTEIRPPIRDFLEKIKAKDRIRPCLRAE